MSPPLCRPNWPSGLSPRLGLSLLLLGIAAGATGCQKQAVEAAKPKPHSVVVVAPVEREVQDFEFFQGTTDAVESVEIRARVTGYLNRSSKEDAAHGLAFTEGAEVKKGAPLFEIDPRPFQAELDQIQSQVELRKANRKFRQAEIDRNRVLLEKRAISQAEFDQTAAAYEEAIAAVTAAEANVAGAALNVEFTRVTAPIDGRVGRAEVTPGNLVVADNTLLTSIVSVDPMYVLFDVDQRTILRLEQSIREGKIKTRDELIPVAVALVTDEGYPLSGQIDFGDNRFDPSTGTIRVRAVLPNPKPEKGTRMLRPGLSARVRVPIGDPYKALTIPEKAILSDQGQRYALIVDDSGKVEYRKLELGKLDSGMRVVLSGIGAADRVIVSGQQFARPGGQVEAKLEEASDFADAASAPTPAVKVSSSAETNVKP